MTDGPAILPAIIAAIPVEAWNYKNTRERRTHGRMCGLFPGMSDDRRGKLL